MVHTPRDRGYERRDSGIQSTPVTGTLLATKEVGEIWKE
jgi:hypothetical protein